MPKTKEKEVDLDEKVYCVKCKDHTKNKRPELKKAANGRRMVQATCRVCGTKKTKFVG